MNYCKMTCLAISLAFAAAGGALAQDRGGPPRHGPDVRHAGPPGGGAQVRSHHSPGWQGDRRHDVRADRLPTPAHARHPGFQHRDIARFHEHNADVWRSGRWHHGRHNGRLGWWWIVSGVWYFYPAQVLPYPDPYQPAFVAAVPPQPAAQPYWYYCRHPAGYYPYVARCRVTWQPVPAVVR